MGPRMRIRAGLLVLAAAITLPLRSAAQTITDTTQPYTLEGIVAKDQAAAREAGWFPISVGAVGSQSPARWIGLTSFLTWSDDPFVGRQMIRRLMPDTPTLLVTGPPDLVKQFMDAPAGTRLVARGMLVPESRNFMLSAVKVAAPEGK